MAYPRAVREPAVRGSAVRERLLLGAILTAQPPVHDLVRDAEFLGDLPQGRACLAEITCAPLVRAPCCSSFGRPDVLLQLPDLAAGRSRRLPGRSKEIGRAFPPVIIGAHMAGAAQRDQVVEAVVAGEPIRVDVVNVERAPVLLRGLAAVTTDAIARPNQLLGLLPSGPVRLCAPAAPPAVELASKRHDSAMLVGARLRAELAARPSPFREPLLCSASLAPELEPARSILFGAHRGAP